MAEVNDCVLCCKAIQIYSVGICNHHVCFECMARMRVLCVQYECPICRKKLEKVVLTTSKENYEKIGALEKMLVDDKLGFVFESKQIKEQFYEILEHRCIECNKCFDDFESLQYHMRKVHSRFSCDLCLENIKIFSKERKFYDRHELGTHRRKGDKDMKAHKGHPLCEFCDVRFFDKDALYKHLRTAHYFCHICDLNGTNDFYCEISSLKEHFRKSHFLCEEGNCATEHFTNVFKNEIDLKAHLALQHTFEKHKAKQMRQIDLMSGSASELPSEVENPRRDKVVPKLDENQFPALAGGSSKPQLVETPLNLSKKFGKALLANTYENFPSLGPNQPRNEVRTGEWCKEKKQENVKRVPAKQYMTQKVATVPTSKAPTKTKAKTKEINGSFDFPALPGFEHEELHYVSKPLNYTKLQTTKAVETKPVPKPSLKQININSQDAFPTLVTGKQNKVPAKVTYPMQTIINASPYLQPFDSVYRNKVLKERLTSILQESQLTNFQTASKSFLSSRISASQYVLQCQNVLKTNFQQIFPELLVLLPNINKQQSIFQLLKSDGLKKSLIAKKNLKECGRCHQVLLATDESFHEQQHKSSTDFLN